MKFIGVTRFSIVTNKTIGSFRLTRDRTLDEAKKIVFSEANLNSRISYLESFCLPTYKMLSQAHDSAYGIILINSDLPKYYKDRILQMCNPITNLIVAELGEDDGPRTVVKPIVRELVGSDKVFLYRYDDDDALPIDFLSNVERISQHLPINNLISFNFGYALSRISDSNFSLKWRKYPMNAFGLGILTDPSDLKNIFELGHHRNISLPVHNDTGKIGWLCTVHDVNDSRIGNSLGEIIPKKIVLEALEHRFPQITESSLNRLGLRRAPG